MPGKVVVGVDGSEASKRALRRAVHEAGLRGADVDAVYVFASTRQSILERAGGWPEGYLEGRTPEQVAESAQRRAEDMLQGVIDEALEDKAGTKIRLVAIPAEQNPAEALIEHARDADLLVVGTRGLGGFKGVLLGSVAQQAAQHATCAVLVLPTGLPD